jgi:hypothetical protein
LENIFFLSPSAMFNFWHLSYKKTRAS